MNLQAMGSANLSLWGPMLLRPPGRAALSWARMSQRLHEVLRAVFESATTFPSEDAFQAAFTAALGDCERELRAAFAPPVHPPRRPPLAALDELERRRTPVPPEGRDPCARAAKLDVLWAGSVPIELKYRTQWNADTYGYMFLKDLHRLERMVAAGAHTKLSSQRYAIFVTTEAVYWKGARPEPEPFWLTDGRAIGPRYWVQYDQPSPDTRWYRYPPFYLANSYTFTWHDLGRAGRYLLLEVLPPQAAGT